MRLYPIRMDSVFSEPDDPLPTIVQFQVDYKGSTARWIFLYDRPQDTFNFFEAIINPVLWPICLGMSFGQEVVVRQIKEMV